MLKGLVVPLCVFLTMSVVSLAGPKASINKKQLLLLEAETHKVNGEIFNAGWENQSVSNIAMTVRDNVGQDVKIMKTKKVIASQSHTL